MIVRNTLILALIGLLVFPAFNLATLALAQQAPAPKVEATDEQRLIQKVKEEIMKELREGNFLGQQIEIGIQKYIKKQQDAQAAARAQEERVAAEKAKKVRRVSASRDHIYGNPNAPISLIEYSDFECPFCKRFHPTAKEIVDIYGGKVNWVYRHFPLPIHNPGAQIEAEASECVNELGGNEAFWKFTDAIYARTQSNGNGFPVTQLVPLGKEIGLNEKRFQECLSSGKGAARVREDIDEGNQIGITGTPANILLKNATGEVAVKFGAMPLDAFKADVDRLLGKPAANKPAGTAGK
jgi:protein-disulfide isomerase